MVTDIPTFDTADEAADYAIKAFPAEAEKARKWLRNNPIVNRLVGLVLKEHPNLNPQMVRECVQRKLDARCTAPD